MAGDEISDEGQDDGDGVGLNWETALEIGSVTKGFSALVQRCGVALGRRRGQVSTTWGQTPERISPTHTTEPTVGLQQYRLITRKKVPIKTSPAERKRLYGPG